MTARARGRVSSAGRAVLTRRSLGRAVIVAAVVAAVTSLIGIVVAWQLVGNLQRSTRSTLVIVQDTLGTVDDTLDVADSIIGTVGDSVETLRSSIDTLVTSVDAGAGALDAVAGITEDIPPTLERVDGALGTLESASGLVDDTLRQVSNLPFGPDYDADRGLSASVSSVREDLRPLADGLTEATAELRALSGSSDDLIDQLTVLGEDLDDIDTALSDSDVLIDRYRRNTAEAIALTGSAQDDLDRDVRLSRALIVILGLAVAVGQIAPLRIGRELARTPVGAPVATGDGARAG